MNALSLLAEIRLPSAPGEWLGILFYVAVAAVVLWGIFSLYQWAVSKGFSVPAPVRIIFICLVSIFLIVLLFRLFGVAL